MTTISLYTGDVPALNQPQPTFDTNTQAFIDYIANLAPEINNFAGLLNALSTTDTSVTSNTVGTGSKTFTVSAGKSFFIGMSLTIANTASPTNRMFAVVTSYSGTTLQVTSQAFEGTGTFTAWSISASFNGVIGSGQIQASAVLAAAIADLNVTNAKLAQAYINDLTAVTLDPATDYLAISDGSDSGNKKKALLPDATATAKGISELATDVEYVTGTDETRTVTVAVARANNLVLGTVVNTTSGTSHDVTGIPSWVKRISINFAGVSTNGTSFILVQIGDSGGIENTGYISSASAGNALASNATGYLSSANIGSAASTLIGSLVIEKLTGNTWVILGTSAYDANVGSLIVGSKTLSATLDRIRFTTVNGTDVFDAGSFNIIYE